MQAVLLVRNWCGLVYLKKARHEIRKMMSSPSYSTPHDTLETKKQFVYVPQKQISSLQPSIFRGKHFKLLPSVTSGINTSQQHRLPISRVTQKGVTKKGRKGQTIWREPQKKHISALWVQFHPKRWSCFIFECYDLFLTTFFGDVLGLQLWKDFGQLEFHAEHATPEVHFLWSFGHLFLGQVFLYLSEPGAGSDTARISTNCTELWLRIVTNQSPLFRFEDPFCFRTPVSLLQKSVALRFPTELLVSEKQQVKGTSLDSTMDSPRRETLPTFH